MLHLKSKIKLNHFCKVFLLAIFLASSCAPSPPLAKAKSKNINNFFCKDVANKYTYIMEESKYIGRHKIYKDFFTEDKIDAALVKNLFIYFDSENILFSKKEVKQLKLAKKNNLIRDLKNNDCSWYDQLLTLYFKNNKKTLAWYEKNILSGKLNSTLQEVIKKTTVFENKNLKINWDKMSLNKAAKILNFSKNTVKLIQTNRHFSLIKFIVSVNKQTTESFAKYPNKAYSKEVILKETILFAKEALFSVADLKQDRYHKYLSIIVTSLDPHSSYIKPTKKNKKISDALDNKGSSGLGVLLKCFSKSCLIIDVFKKGAAFNKIKKGDLIIAANSFYKKDLSQQDFFHKLRGQKGSLVNITVLRTVNGQAKEINIPIVRNLIESNRIQSKLLKNKTAYIKLESFYGPSKNFKSSSEDFAQALKDLDPKANSLIIDLQDNRGGHLSDVTNILGYLLLSADLLTADNQHAGCGKNLKQQNNSSGLFKDGSIVRYIKNENPIYGLPVVSYFGLQQFLEFSCNRNVYFANKPIVVLINNESASASEILALGLQKANRAIILGSKYSFGKGNGQSIPEDGLLKLTTFLWGSFLGDSVQSVGVKSDIEITFFKTKIDPTDRVEKSLPRALPVTKIPNFYSQINDTSEKWILEVQKKISALMQNFIKPLRAQSLNRQRISKQNIKNQSRDKKENEKLVINEAVNILIDFKKMLNTLHIEPKK